MTHQAAELVPLGFALFPLLFGSLPPGELVPEPLLIVGHRAKPLVSSERCEGAEVINDGRLGERGWPASSRREVLESLQQSQKLGALLVRFVGDLGSGQQAPDSDALLVGRWLVLLIEGGLGDLVWREFLGSGDALVVFGGPDVTCSQEDQDGTVHRITRPTERRRPEALVKFGASCASGADGREYFFADAIADGVALMAYGVKRVRSTVTCPGDDLRPVGVVSGSELGE
jgi:hypothetical protein